MSDTRSKMRVCEVFGLNIRKAASAVRSLHLHGGAHPQEAQGERPASGSPAADIRPLPDWSFKHFTACDVITRWHVLELPSRATAPAAAGFLDAILERTPFPVRAIQLDGGSEFMAQFEMACQERGIQLFVLPPRSPKLNGHVERAQRTHREEFYRFAELPHPQ